MNEEYLEHIGVKGMKWGVRKAANAERKANVTKAKEAHKQSVAKADVAWNLEFAKVKKNNPNANYGDLVNKALNTPYVKKTQSEAYKARMAIKKAKKTPISERKASITKAKELHKQSITKADAAWNLEFAKVKKNNPNANYGDLVSKTLSTPSVKKTQSEAYKARMAIKKAKKTY